MGEDYGYQDPEVEIKESDITIKEKMMAVSKRWNL